MLCGAEWSAQPLLDSICHVFLTSPASYPSPPILKRASVAGRNSERRPTDLLNLFRLFTDALPPFPGYFWHIDSLHFDSNFTIEGNTNDCECVTI